MPGKLQVAFRLFGEAKNWSDRRFVESRGEINIHLDVEVAWISQTENGKTDVLSFYKNQQPIARLLANAILRRNYPTAPPLTKNHYLHQAFNIDPSHIKKFLEAKAPWLAEAYHVAGDGLETVEIKTILQPEAIDTTYAALNGTWCRAFLSWGVPKTIELLEYNLKLVRRDNDLEYTFTKTADLTIPIAADCLRAVYLADAPPEPTDNPYLWVGPPHIGVRPEPSQETWKAQITTICGTSSIDLEKVGEERSVFDAHVSKILVRFRPSEKDGRMDALWDRKVRVMFQYSSACECVSSGSWRFDSTVPFQKMKATVECDGLAFDDNIIKSQMRHAKRSDRTFFDASTLTYEGQESARLMICWTRKD